MKFVLITILLNIVIIMNPFEKYLKKLGGLIAMIKIGIFAVVSNMKFHSLLAINVNFE